MRQVRVGLISHIIETVLLLIMALVNTISANTAGCKNPADDPNASVEGYIDKLPGFCRNKRALTAFYWLALVAWAVSTVVIVRRFHAVRRSATRIPPFVPPQGPHDAEFEAGEPDEAYDPAPPMSYANGPASRPSGTYYSADRPFGPSIASVMCPHRGRRVYPSTHRLRGGRATRPVPQSADVRRSVCARRGGSVRSHPEIIRVARRRSTRRRPAVVKHGTSDPADQLFVGAAARLIPLTVAHLVMFSSAYPRTLVQPLTTIR